MSIFRQIPNNSMVSVTFVGENSRRTGLLKTADEYGFSLVKANKLHFIPWSAVAMLTVEPRSEESSEED